MSTPKTESFATYIDRITEETRSGRMAWVSTSPTTFVWTKQIDGAPVAQLSLQKVLKRKAVRGPSGSFRIENHENYVFQATDTSTGNVRLNVNSQTNPEAKEPLRNLYAALESMVERGGLEFLKEIIDT